MSYTIIKEGLWYRVTDGKLELLGEGATELYVDIAGNKRYFLNGLLHREDGPALLYADESYGEWYINGRLIHPVWLETRGLKWCMERKTK